MLNMKVASKGREKRRRSFVTESASIFAPSPVLAIATGNFLTAYIMKTIEAITIDSRYA